MSTKELLGSDRLYKLGFFVSLAIGVDFAGRLCGSRLLAQEATKPCTVAAKESTGQPEPNTLQAIAAVTEDGQTFTCTYLSDITEPEKLRELSINGGRVADADLHILRRARDLDLFVLPGFWEGEAANITDAGLERIARLRKLRFLTVGGNKITDVGIARLSSLKTLVDLDIFGLQITDVGILQLGELPNLTTLRLSVPQFTDQGLAKLGALERLSWIDLRGTSVAGVGFASIKDREHKLEIVEGNFSDEGLRTISELRSGIEFLHIVGRQMTNLGLVPLAKIKSLRSVLLEGTSVTETAAKRLLKDCPWLIDVSRS